MTNEVMIRAVNLTKVYGGRRVVAGLSFECRRGEVVGFLGVNGAGKTTTMRILAGYIPPTSGAAYVAGYHTVDQSLAARQQIGYLPETAALYLEMTVMGYLTFVGRLRRVEQLPAQIQHTLQSVGLTQQAQRRIGSLSKGMRQRVALAQALLHNPAVLILDEPTIGLDPAQIQEIRQLICSLGKERTILLSTHILSEVEQICQQVLILMDGRLQADMVLPQSGIEVEKMWFTLKLMRKDAGTLSFLQSLPYVYQVQNPSENNFVLQIASQPEARQLLVQGIVAQNYGLLELSPNHTDLETVFMNQLRTTERKKESHR